MRSSNYLRQAKRRQNRSVESEHLEFTPNDKIVGKDTLAHLLEVSVTQIERWLHGGMPVDQRGDHLNEWMFNLNDVQRWLAAKDGEA